MGHFLIVLGAFVITIILAIIARRVPGCANLETYAFFGLLIVIGINIVIALKNWIWYDLLKRKKKKDNVG